MRSRTRPPLDAELLYVDADVLVVNKPAGVVLGRGGSGHLGLPELLEGRGGFEDTPSLRIVHRLHEHASGVVVYARSRAAQQELIGQFREGTAEVTYLAIVTGHVAADGQIDQPLYFDTRLGKLQASQSRGRPAATRYRVIERICGHTVLECRPLRERTDQVRAHLAAIGHPLAVDPQFGGAHAVRLSDYKADYRPSRRRPERPLVQRLTLHAARVRFRHPSGGGPLEFAAPLPKDLRATLNQLRRLV